MSSTQSLAGFDDNLEPVRSSRAERAARRSANVNPYVKGRTRSYSNPSLRTVPEDITESSNGSLAWDHSPNLELSYNIPLRKERTDSLRGNFEFEVHDEISIDKSQDNSHLFNQSICLEMSATGNTNQSGQTVFNTANLEDIGNDPSISAGTNKAEMIRKYKAAICLALMELEDDLEVLDIGSTSIVTLDERVKYAQKLKIDLTDAILNYPEIDQEGFSMVAEKATDVRKRLIAFINSGLTHMKDQPNAPVPNSTGNNVVSNIKAERIRINYTHTNKELQSLCNEFDIIRTIRITTDGDYYSAREKFDGLNKRMKSVLEDARLLVSDATDISDTRTATETERNMRELKNRQVDAEKRLDLDKDSRGIRNASVSSKAVDLKPPEFSADTGLDFYTFKKEFLEYCAVKSMSKADELKVLTRTCLKGTPKHACMNMTDISAV